MYTFFGNTDVGRVRKNNEDYFADKKIGRDEHLFIVADGMGGHQAGDIASSLGTNVFIKNYKKLRAGNISISDSLNQSLLKANAAILDKATKEPDKKGMGTTFSALVLKRRKGYIIHIGDSRIYRIRKNKIERLTKDHTFVEKMLDEGRITEKEARNHPHRNILYYSLGARDNLSPQIIKDLDIKDKDAFLLCSDGLNTMVEDPVLKDYCLLYPPEKGVNELIKIANENGGTDNITIQILHFGNVYSQDNTEPLNVVEFRKKNRYLFFIPLFVVILIIVFLIFYFI